MRLIRDPQFAEAHLSYFLARPEASYILLLGFGKGVYATDQELVPPRNSPVPPNHHLFHTHRPCSNIVNGLICLRNGSRLAIYNLSTGEKRDLPPTRITDHGTTFAFGFNSVSKKYKLLLFRGHVASEILTVGRKSSWKDMLGAPAMMELSLDPIIYVAGKIYFIELRALNKFFIRFFDLTSEKFGTIDPPSNSEAPYPNPCFGNFEATYPNPRLVQAGGNLGFLANDYILNKSSTLVHHWTYCYPHNWVERGMFWYHPDKVWASIGTGDILLGSSEIRLFDPTTSWWSREKINNNPRDSTCYTHISCNHVENILPLSSMD
ncbi:unnamed protein product [Cuscuta campestris]|uniref:F-box associated beta-propeller type 3 domain-containing protein n=1 Tax=Cuscuta campestris TaxID=132261 RepID=A0A484NAY0_9ASTE|nr:unnamed protein product [Cuscuta campestris]